MTYDTVFDLPNLCLFRRTVICVHVDLPPAKRRRGLAGSIVTTAWNAALIGTAVGLSVYKLWRNRGKGNEEEKSAQATAAGSSTLDDITYSDMMIVTPPEPSSPPPPYNNHDWTKVNYPLPTPNSKGKQRMTPRSTHKTHTARRDRHTASRKLPIHNRPVASARLPVAPEFNFQESASDARKRGRQSYGAMDDSVEEEGDDQMDWIGGKLAQLIEEGKRALGTEVVVMSEAKEDEVDDGSGLWVSDEEERGGLKRQGSTRSTRSRRGTVTGGSYQVSSSLPSSSSVPSTPRRTHSKGISYDGASPLSAISSAANDNAGNFESPEVREMMERARAKLAARMVR
ncbi:hypothetical protein FA15DRAFT_473639 [Coprinopsis marcescibilis]|uniref:Uncharacterized protein n=1 Tax=Coprinopsis marcescibilis TaxID=230819 RepID=A0A5C3KRU0_COPMA|nr:hypothetical protein FA15DRAFT_473639 [Coprinopsis marcescibilis]